MFCCWLVSDTKYSNPNRVSTGWLIVFHAFGLEVSETAVKRCYEEQEANGLKYPVRDETVGAGAVKFMHGDFFGTDWMINIEGDGKVDLIYDYTVGKLCSNGLGSRAACLRRYSPNLATDEQLNSFSRLCHQAFVLTGHSAWRSCLHLRAT